MAPDLIPAAIGFSSHSGWAAAVCLGGAVSSSVVIERSRLLLTSAPLPHEPYHDAKRGGPDKAEEIVAGAAEEARILAVKAIECLASSVTEHGYKVVSSGVALRGGRPDRTLSQSLSTHAAMHAAEGWLFREALIEASQTCDLMVVGLPERELAARAAAALGAPEAAIGELLQRLGRDHGPPWARDQKAATMAALVALSSVS